MDVSENVSFRIELDPFPTKTAVSFHSHHDFVPLDPTSAGSFFFCLAATNFFRLSFPLPASALVNRALDFSKCHA